MNEKFTKVKGWVKDHKWQIAGGCLAIGGMVGAYYLGKSMGVTPSVEGFKEIEAKDISSKSSDIVMDLIADADGSTSHFDIWAETGEVVASIGGVTDLSAEEAIKSAIKVMKDEHPFYDYKKGSVILEFVKPDGVEITNF